MVTGCFVGIVVADALQRQAAKEGVQAVLIEEMVEHDAHRFRWWKRFDIEVRSEEHTSELQSLMRISYAVFCLKKKRSTKNELHRYRHIHTLLTIKEDHISNTT